MRTIENKLRKILDIGEPRDRETAGRAVGNSSNTNGSGRWPIRCHRPAWPGEPVPPYFTMRREAAGYWIPAFRGN